MTTIAALEAQTPRVGLPQSIAWASGSVATAAISNTISIYGLFYLSVVAGIDIGLAGTLILVSKLYDAFTDPVMGAISDRTRHRLGRRRVYVGVGSVLTGLSMALFLGAGGLVGGLHLAGALVLLLVLSTSYTIFSVPYLAMPPDLAPEYDKRTQLMSFRMVFIMIGVTLGSVGGPLLLSRFEDQSTGFMVLGLLLGALIIVFGLIAFFGTAGADPDMHPKEVDASPISMYEIFVQPFQDLVQVLGNAPFRLLTIVKLLQLAVLATALACTPYFFSSVLGRGQADIGAYLGIFTVVGLLIIAPLRYLLRFVGKRQAFVYLLVGYACVMASWYFWTESEPGIFFYVRAVGLGIFSTGTVLCALALLPDTMEYDRLVSGRSREGIMSGVFTLVEKVSSAIGPFIVGWVLASQGLIQATGGEIPDQPEDVVAVIKLAYSLIPAAITLSCIPFLLRYNLNEAELEQARLAAGEHSQAKAF